MGSIEGKRVIVTGGRGNIGNAVIHALHKEGARVACTYHSSSPDVPAGVTTARCNVKIRGEVDSTFDSLVEELEGLDALIHAAGIHDSSPAELVTESEWEEMFAVNCKAAMLTNQAAFRHLHGRGGVIVNMGSVEGIRGNAGSACYAATRGGVMAWTRSIALEWGRYDIRVNCVAPVVAERMRAHQDELSYTESEAQLARAIPLGRRIGDPLQDLAPVLLFLVSDASRFITGQTIAVDGGYMMLGS